jgi:hypothetical protein
MFSGCPWGGYGANPIPTAMQTDWDQHGSLISGGMPYSEGIYLDMNQVMRCGTISKKKEERRRHSLRFQMRAPILPRQA